VTGSPLVVLHVLEALSSGTSRHVVDLVRNAPEIEHHVAVPARRSTGLTDESATEAIRSAGSTVHVIDMRRQPLTLANSRALPALARLARRVDADVVHGHSAIGGVLVRSLPIKAKRVYTPHGFAQGRGAAAVERLLGRRTDALVAVSDSEADLAREAGFAPADRVVAISNGVEPGRTPRSGALREVLGLPEGALLVGSVGRLAPQKSPLDLLAAWRLVATARPDAHLVLVGDGPMSQQVEAAAAPLPRVHLLRHLDDAASAIADADLFLLLSAYEGCPYVALEAARGGVPLLLTDVVGNRDIVRHGTTGVLVPHARPDLAAAEVLRLLGDAELRTRLAAAMSARLEQVFNVHEMAAAHRRLYARLVAGG
jgi:glycosyltransferase involved in cell wall biosynthesis